MKLAPLLIALIATSATAADLEIKGVRPGMTKAELQAAHPGLDCARACYYLSSLRGERIPSLETLAGARVASWWFTFSDEGKLGRSYIVLPNSSAAIVRTAFVEKFGLPTKEEKAEFKTAAGFSGEKIINTWTSGDAAIVLTSPSGKINEMRVEIYSTSFLNAEVDARKAKARSDM